jgi:replicative DNA helicase
MDYRQEPQDIAAEKSIIGAMLIDKDTIGDVMRILQPSDFFNEQNHDIYGTIIDMYNKNEVVDIVTVSNRMNAPQLVTQLSDLAVSIPTVANAKHYAGIVKGKSIRRQVIKAAMEVIDASYEGHYESLTDYRNDVLAKMDIQIKDSNIEKRHIRHIVTETIAQIEERYGREDKNMKYYGIPWLDKHTGGAVDGEMTILAARPSCGKTAFSLQVALHMAYRNKHVAIFSLEMNRHVLVERLFAHISAVNLQKIRYAKNLDEIDFKAIIEASTDIASMNINIFDSVHNVEEIRSVCRDLKNKGQLDYVVIDYLQLCGSIKRTSGATELVSHISRSFKLMTLEFEIPFLVLSQLNRENQKENKMPKLTDLRQSGSLEQDTDNVFFLHDPDYGDAEESAKEKREIQIIIAKQRNGEKDIFNKIIFEPSSQRFMELTGRDIR